MRIDALEPATQAWVDSTLSDEDFVTFAQALLARGDIAMLPKMLVLSDRHQSVWASENGQMLIVEMLQLLIESLEGGDAGPALAAMSACPPRLAEQAYELLLMAFFPDGAGDPADLDDAAFLCLVLLLGASGQREAVAPLIDRVKVARISSYFHQLAEAIRAHFAPPFATEAFKPKLIIWDLDDTLWEGTLADGDEPVLHQHRVDYLRAFNGHGIVSAICSKNDFATARAKLEAFGLWDAFVFPRIAFVPKGAVIRQMIADMQLRPVNVLFIDDNPHNLHEVADAVPGIHVMDATSPECDALLAQILEDHRHIQKSRVEDYRLLETKVTEREDNALSDEDFLLQSEIHATHVYRMDNLEFADRIEELINRSNQLNYTQSRAEPGSIRQRILDIDHWLVLSVFVWDKYGYYGLVGVAVFNVRTNFLEHFAFSCRIMHMGVEDFLIRTIERFHYKVDAAHLRKPLPPQSARAIRRLEFHDTAVRERVLAQEAPRDWSKIRLRLMADCQSAAFHHYSRCREEADFDNAPRLFSLPMMLDDSHRDQLFPPYLVYTVATDYVDWRWRDIRPEVDVDLFRSCVEKFERFVIAGNHKCLLFLPPQDCPVEMYKLFRDCNAERAKSLHPILNDFWRDVARRNPDHFDLVEVPDHVAREDMVHAHHYVPSALKHISGMIDDWYEAKKAGATAQ